MIGFKWKNVSTVLGNLRAEKENRRKRLAAAVYVVMNAKATIMKERTPVDTGTLRATLYVEEPEFVGNHVICRVVCGGPSAPYAIYVHEDLEVFHAVGQAKFIESVLNEAVAYIGAEIAERMRV